MKQRESGGEKEKDNGRDRKKEEEIGERRRERGREQKRCVKDGQTTNHTRGI